MESWYGEMMEMVEGMEMGIEMETMMVLRVG